MQHGLQAIPNKNVSVEKSLLCIHNNYQVYCIPTCYRTTVTTKVCNSLSFPSVSCPTANFCRLASRSSAMKRDGTCCLQYYHSLEHKYLYLLPIDIQPRHPHLWSNHIHELLSTDSNDWWLISPKGDVIGSWAPCVIPVTYSCHPPLTCSHPMTVSSIPRSPSCNLFLTFDPHL